MIFVFTTGRFSSLRGHVCLSIKGNAICQHLSIADAVNKSSLSIKRPRHNYTRLSGNFIKLPLLDAGRRPSLIKRIERRKMDRGRECMDTAERRAGKP